MDKPLHRSTQRVLEIMELVSGSASGYTLTQLSSALSAPKSSLFPILQTLRAKHFLSYSVKEQLYKIGPAAFQVGMSFVNKTNIMGFVEREIDEIVKRCLETVHFAIIDNGNVVYLIKKDSPQAVRMISTVGLTMPAYGAAIGKALLIDKNIEELRDMYPDGLKPLTNNTITDFETLHTQLLSFRKDDISYEYEESNTAIRCVGAALRRGGEIVSALSIAAPIFRCSDADMEKYRSMLLESKQKLEHFFQDLRFDLAIQ
jgi:DNA-binding IclR family transcriptional regulator